MTDTEKVKAILHSMDVCMLGLCVMNARCMRYALGARI